uniref:Zinc finger CCCH-type, RNA binding motif and serine/arginine rich 2 n=1 Tax=Callorhinchus milii TaxID=7868 RepID=A0A4W3HYN7_CALMI
MVRKSLVTLTRAVSVGSNNEWLERKERSWEATTQLTAEEDVEPEVGDLDEEEKQLEAERSRLHTEWLETEIRAQEEFRLKKEKEEVAQKKQEEEERRIKEEWEQQQMKEKEVEESKLQERREREEAVQKMLDQAENQIQNDGTWHNPEAPEDYGTEKDKSYCPFFLKTGSCRFGDRCSRKHVYPSTSPTLLIRAMFITFGMEECRRDDYDTDAGLEYSEDDIYQQFVEFYEDVLPEFKSVGKVLQFKVSCNYEPHLRGNVYVQYQKEEECKQACVTFNGRWYAGKQLQCEFSPVTRWKTAICGLYERRKCPRGKHCNFLHVFRNPGNEFWEADRDIHMSPDRTKQYSNKYSERRDRTSCRYDYHGRSRRWYNDSPDKAQRRSGDSERKRKRSRSRERRRSQRSRSRSQERKRSRSRDRYRRSRSREMRRSQRSRSRSQDRRSPSRDRSRYRSKSKSVERSQSLSHSRSRSRGRSRGRSVSKGRGNGQSRSRSKPRSRSRDKEQSRSRSPSHGRSKKSKDTESKSKKSKKKKAKKEKKKNKSEGKSKNSKKRQESNAKNTPTNSKGKDTQVTKDNAESRSLSTSSTKSSMSDIEVSAKQEDASEKEAKIHQLTTVDE